MQNAGVTLAAYLVVMLPWLVRNLSVIGAPLPVGAPAWAVVLAMVNAVASGVVFGLLPARRAARLDPVVALAGRR